MFYQLYELNHAFLSPARAFNDAMRLYYKNPLNPMSHTPFGRQVAAAGDVFERLTRRYAKPAFELTRTEVDGHPVAVTEEVVWQRPFCRLLHFARALPKGTPRQPNLVIVAPMSGHYATLLRGTVAAMLPTHEVFITDWADARMVPLAAGRFDLDDYIDYVIDIVRHFRGDLHMVAVCQPAVPVFAATALMEADEGIHPKSITLMGGPIDTRENPTEVNIYAAKHDLDWFRRSVIQRVPFPHPGMMRQVYPGFLQLTGFMTMNLDRHLSAHYDYFDHLVKGDGEPAEKHRDFYDEYLSVMDLTAEFYLQTVDTVFLRHALPRGLMAHRNRLVDPRRITRTPILTVEGENDDISGIGQTRAAHKLTPNLAAEMHGHHEQAGVGHYGVFNGSRFRREIAPRIAEWTLRWDARGPALGTPAPEPVAAASSTAEAVLGAAAAAMATAAATFANFAPPPPADAAARTGRQHAGEAGEDAPSPAGAAMGASPPPEDTARDAAEDMLPAAGRTPPQAAGQLPAVGVPAHLLSSAAVLPAGDDAVLADVSPSAIEPAPHARAVGEFAAAPHPSPEPADGRALFVLATPLETSVEAERDVYAGMDVDAGADFAGSMDFAERMDVTGRADDAGLRASDEAPETRPAAAGAVSLAEPADSVTRTLSFRRG